MYVVRTRYGFHLAHKAQTVHPLHLLYPLNPSKLGVRDVRFLPDRSGCFKQFVVHGDTHGKVLRSLYRLDRSLANRGEPVRVVEDSKR
jgi:hypothetical protein